MMNLMKSLVSIVRTTTQGTTHPSITPRLLKRTSSPSTTALRAAANRRQCSTSFNLDSKVEEFYEREEHLNVKIATLTEENIRSKRNNRDLHRVIRAKTFVDALGPSATAKTIRSIAEDLSPETRSAMLIGVIGSQRD